MYSFRLVYIFSYNLFQFCGHTWILANTIARFFTFGQDALADTFYSVGFVMSLCQLLSILEIFHIADGIEKARLLPRFIQVIEKNILLIVVIMLEEIQSKPVVCVQFFLWNILALLRYPYELLCVVKRPSVAMLWSRYSLWIPLYILSVVIEGVREPPTDCSLLAPPGGKEKRLPTKPDASTQQRSKLRQNLKRTVLCLSH
ncbi:very-long-chain (3R)-3-hydroxyacyl-CoA dehydratase 4 isoform X2 [Poeciliopsis prolifica]|uniref:very-long-chain (3R)-3-hydroxyacyl-CoA dehydratase 4 isoform X2 n=1 Tax=Poeciliopsis prolifica TaxID=188132 RepID=UPI0024145235|nr:very-long-chain (3R)-3-hydroxyacyl-CoA dehydratase 4 isoform X2 [Poeciliopsis prolifica]